MHEAWTAHVSRASAFYAELSQRYGHDPRASDYGSAASQRTKFGVLAEVMPLAGRSVLDAGCGYADFGAFLRSRWGDVRYEGVDLCPEVIAAAQRIHPGFSLRVMDVLTGDPGGPFDVVFANGLFYLLRDHAELHMRRLIRRLWTLSGTALAFNSLSTWAPRRESDEFQADPLETLDYCRTLTPHVTLRHDYMEHDFTIYLYREARRP